MDHTTNERSNHMRWEVIDRLGDFDPAVRLGAAVELGQRNAADAAPALVERLGWEPDFFIRETLTWAILRVADDALPFVHQALTSPRWLARLGAVHVLGKRGRFDDADRLVAPVGDEVDAVAARAYWAAGQTHNPAVVPALVGQLARGSSEHRNSLTVALAEFGAAAVPALVDALRVAPGAEARLHAADTLSLIGSPGADRAALPLAEALVDPDRRVRLGALNAIGQLAVPFAVRTVEQATGAAEPIFRHLAVRLAGGRTAGFGRQVARPRAPAAGDLVGRADGVQGMIAAADGVLVELTCETQFVAQGATFRALGQRIADLAATLPAADAAGLLGAPCADGTLADAVAGLCSAAGEKVELGRVVRRPGRTTAYLHANAVGRPPRVGALVAFDGGPGAEEIAQGLALQVVLSSPEHMTRDGIPADVLATVRIEAEELARARGATAAAAARIVAGRVEQFVHNTVLLEQVSVVDPGKTVTDLLFGKGVHVTGFARLEVGSGRR